jgi:tetraacyldisaccharide 4'-kinase
MEKQVTNSEKQKRFPRRGCAGALLLPFGLAYRLGVGLRNFGYDWGVLLIHHLPVPVVSVGNITTGGTGKTPTVIRLCKMLRDIGRKPAVLTRGYRGGEKADEVIEMRAVLAALEPSQKEESDQNKEKPSEKEENTEPQQSWSAPVIVNPDRVAGGLQAVGKHGADVLVLDDGFQHRRLNRDVDIVLIDATNPFGYGSLLPRGLLREPPSRLKRADIIVVTRSDALDENEKNKLADRLRRYSRNKPVVFAVHKATRLWDIKTGKDVGESPVPASLPTEPVLAFSGLGNPEALPELLKKLNYAFTDHIAFPDHHAYTASEIPHLARRAELINAKALLTTRKDWAKIADFKESKTTSIPLWVLDVEVEFRENGEIIEKTLSELWKL